MKKGIDKILVFTVIIAGLLGILMIYSSSSVWAEYKFNDPLKYVKHQFLFYVVGLLLMLFLSKVDISYYKKYANKILLGCFILLVLVLIPGIGKVRNGARSWFGIGSLGIQPSEFAKIGLIIFVSKYLAKNDHDVKQVVKGLFPILGVIFLFFGLIMLEPDFGQGMVIVLTLIMIIFISGAKVSFFVKCGILGLVGIVILIIIAPYRLARIVSFVNPWVDPLGSGFQIIQSLYAIGPGGLLGLGFGSSIQKHFYLPEPQTDFIFSIISEEFGFLGAVRIHVLQSLYKYFYLYLKGLKSKQNN